MSAAVKDTDEFHAQISNRRPRAVPKINIRRQHRAGSLICFLVAASVYKLCKPEELPRVPDLISAVLLIPHGRFIRAAGRADTIRIRMLLGHFRSAVRAHPAVPAVAAGSPFTKGVAITLPHGIRSRRKGVVRGIYANGRRPLSRSSRIIDKAIPQQVARVCLRILRIAEHRAYAAGKCAAGKCPSAKSDVQPVLAAEGSTADIRTGICEVIGNLRSLQTAADDAPGNGKAAIARPYAGSLSVRCKAADRSPVYFSRAVLVHIDAINAYRIAHITGFCGGCPAVEHKRPAAADIYDNGALLL